MDIWHNFVQGYPDWMLFACLVKGKPVIKPFVTRVLEAVLIAFIGALAGGYLAVAISNARLEERHNATDTRLTDHIVQETERDKRLFAAINDLRDCLIKRCNK